uniref:Uncharacterized protein n=1 Tax=Stomoxys calcitrans TaxID=35570 RepID=A0A1I8Q994_STOCA
MVNITLCNIIAYFSAVLTFFGSIFSCFFLVIDVKNLNRPVKKSDGTMWFVTESDVASMAIDTISNVAIFIASVFLIIGIKRRHHTFVAPWVFVVAICVVLNLLKLIPNQETLLQSLVSVDPPAWDSCEQRSGCNFELQSVWCP